MSQTASKNSSIDDIRTVITPIASKYGVERIFLFGSRARGDNSEDSDYDLLVSLGAIKNMVQLGCFVDDLTTALNKNVDVISDQSENQILIQKAKNEGILIFEL